MANLSLQIRAAEEPEATLGTIERNIPKLRALEHQLGQITAEINAITIMEPEAPDDIHFAGYHAEQAMECLQKILRELGAGLVH
jgi:hypothetical protein